MLGPVLTIGNFDGVHLGHQALLQQCKKLAVDDSKKVVVLTFFPHPIEVLRPELGHQRLFSIVDQQDQLKLLGADEIHVQKFTKEFASLSASDFLQQVVSKFHPSCIVVGDDFGFGANKSGNLNFLQEFCRAGNIGLTIVPEVNWQGERVSSTLIKAKIRSGLLGWANSALRRPFYLEGTVVSGDQRGRVLGFPTANLGSLEQVIPKNGVYVTRTFCQDQWWSSVTNVGINKTFKDSGEIKVETHILDFSRQIYGQQIKVEFLNYLRDEKKFSNLEELKTQIQLDRQTARDFHDQNS